MQLVCLSGSSAVWRSGDGKRHLKQELEPTWWNQGRRLREENEVRNPTGWWNVLYCSCRTEQTNTLNRGTIGDKLIVKYSDSCSSVNSSSAERFSMSFTFMLMLCRHLVDNRGNYQNSARALNVQFRGKHVLLFLCGHSTPLFSTLKQQQMKEAPGLISKSLVRTR